MNSTVFVFNTMYLDGLHILGMMVVVGRERESVYVCSSVFEYLAYWFNLT